MKNDTKIIKYNKITEIVNKYQSLENKLLKVGLSANNYDILSKSINEEGGLTSRIETIINDMLVDNKYKFITEILQFDSLKNLMTHKQRDKLSKDLIAMSANNDIKISETTAHELLTDIETAFNLCTGRYVKNDFKVSYTAFEDNYVGKYSYFEIKYYKNGNIHIVFTDKSAVDALNYKVGKYFNQLR